MDNEATVMLSALQHYMFCPRQCALIHVEGVWSENYLTASGRTLHERVDHRGGETRRDVHLATALRLVNKRLGLMGVADMVEFRRVDEAVDAEGVVVAAALPGLSGVWSPFPVEYKRGVPKPHRADEVQLCAQALCLEEMLGVCVPGGTLYYGETRRRMNVRFDEGLRKLTERVAMETRKLIISGHTPGSNLDKKCKAGSLVDVCRPDRIGSKSVRKWIGRELGEAIGIGEGE